MRNDTGGSTLHTVFEVVLWDMHWHVLDCQRFEPATDLRGATAATIERLAADGWQAEGNSVHVDVLEIGSGASHNGLSDPQVLYTADMRALENDEIFVDFITGNHDAFVIEDADHLLMARSNGEDLSIRVPPPGIRPSHPRIRLDQPAV
jgi:hypothetical protein